MSGRDTKARTVSPLDALEILTSKRNPRAPVVLPAGDPEARYLAEPLELSPVGGPSRAAWNGYTLGPRQCASCSADSVLRILGTRTPGETFDAHGERLADDAELPAADERSVWRVESGALLPDDADRIVPVADCVLVGTAAVRLERVPAPGQGVAAVAPYPATKVPVGEELDARLRATLLAAAVKSITAWPSFAVGIVAFGDELVAADTPTLPGTQWELTGPWLEDAVNALGLRAVSLGIRPDAPEQMRELLFRAAQREVRVVLAIGGLGSGVTDRTVEGLRRAEAHVLFERVDCAGVENLLFAKALGLEIIGVSGRPREAAAGFDLFARPALLARLGAPATRWDWRLDPAPSSAAHVERASEVLSGASWELQPCGVVVQGQGLGGSLWPRLPGQEGWLLRAGTPGEGPGAPLGSVLEEWRIPLRGP